jgi:prophage regulatory protein
VVVLQAIPITRRYPISSREPATALRRLETPFVLGSLSLSSPRQTEEVIMGRASEAPIRRTIRRQQLREMVPLADSTIYEMEQRNEFPRRFALSPRCVVWDLAEVEAWLASRRSRPIPRAQHPDVAQRRTRPVKARDRATAVSSTAE